MAEEGWKFALCPLTQQRLKSHCIDSPQRVREDESAGESDDQGDDRTMVLPWDMALSSRTRCSIYRNLGIRPKDRQNRHRRRALMLGVIPLRSKIAQRLRAGRRP